MHVTFWAIGPASWFATTTHWPSIRTPIAFRRTTYRLSEPASQEDLQGLVPAYEAGTTGAAIEDAWPNHGQAEKEQGCR